MLELGVIIGLEVKDSAYMTVTVEGWRDELTSVLVLPREVAGHFLLGQKFQITIHPPDSEPSA